MKTNTHSAKLKSSHKKSAAHVAQKKALKKKPIGVRAKSESKSEPKSKQKSMVAKNVPRDVDTEVNDRVLLHPSEEFTEVPPPAETEGLPIRTIPRHVHVEDADDDENSLDAEFSQAGAGDTPDPNDSGGKYFSFKTRDEEIG